MFALDLNQVEDAPEFGPLPVGEYAVCIEDAELKDTQKGGAGINLKMQVVEGPMQGRYVFNWLNVAAPGGETPDWLKISLSQLKQLIVVAGIDTNTPFTDPAVLKGKIVNVRLGMDKNDPDKNKVNAYKPYEKQQAAQPAAQQPVNANPNMPAGQQPAWGN